MKKEATVKIINNSYFLSINFLLSHGFKCSTLYRKLLKAKKGSSSYYQSLKIGKTTWIAFESIPKLDIDKYALPSKEEEIKAYVEIRNEIKRIPELERSFYWTWLEESLWVQFIPYYKEYYLDINLRNQFAKTHAIIQLVIDLKNKNTYHLKQLFDAYQTLKYCVFKTPDYKYFSKKINNCIAQGISETLMHSNIIKGRKPYRVTPLIISRIKFYYLNKNSRYSQIKIQELVNEELILRGLNPISLSTVSRICRDPELRNRADIIRLGKSYANKHINPYLARKSATKLGELYMVDSTPLNFLYKDDKGEVSRLILCAIIDIFSRKIVGYSFDESENSRMICEALKQAFQSNYIIPNQILIDNASSYSSAHFKDVKRKLNEYGVSIRSARLKNPRDKSYIEGWFSKFQKEFLNIMYGSLGDGIKTKRKGGRPDDEVISTYNKNLENRKSLVKRIKEQINQYNETFHNSIKMSPNMKFNSTKYEYETVFNEKDISYLFGLRKEIMVKNSKVIFTNNGIQHHYTIQSRQMANKVNGLKVIVYYDEFDLSYIHVFNTNNTYLGKISEDIRPNIVPKSKLDYEAYNKSFNRIESRIKDNLNDLAREVNLGREILEVYPIVSLDKKRIDRMEAIIKENEEVLQDSLTKYKIISKYGKENQRLMYDHKLFTNNKR